MTTIDYAAPVSGTRSTLADTAGAVFRAPGLFLKRRFIAARTVSELSRLSDRQLDDIGVERVRIGAIGADMAARICD